MKGDAAVGGESLKKFRHEFGVELPYFGFRQIHIEHKKSAAADVDNTLRQSLVERYAGIGKPPDAFLVTQGFRKGFPEGNPHIFHGVVKIDMGIPFGFYGDIEKTMAGHLGQHVIQVRDGGVDVVFPGSVQVLTDRNIRFPGRAFDVGRSSHSPAA